MKRRLRIAVGMMLAIPLAALVALNLFVNVTLPLFLNGDPQRVRIDYTLAWTAFPGTVHVYGLRIRADGERDQWQLTARRATGDIDLLGLRERRFSASNVEGHGVSFRYRLRTDEGETPSEALPSIAGLGPPVPVELPPRGTPWIVDLRGATLAMRELWIEGYRYQGPAELTGSVLLGGAEADADLALVLESGGLSHGTVPMAEGLHGDIGVVIDALPRETGVGRAGFSHVSGEAQLGADVENLSFLHAYLERAPWLLVDGTGRLETDIAFDAGAFRPGSWLVASTRDLSVQVLSYEVRGDGVVRLEITDDDPELPMSHLSVDFGAYTIGEPGQPPLVEGTGFSVDATSPDRALDEAFTTLDVVLVVPESEVRNIELYNAFLPTDVGFALTGGSGTIRGELRASSADNVASGDVWVTGDDVRARLDDLGITLDLELHTKLSEGRLADGVYDFSGTRLELRDVGIVDRGPRERGDKNHDESRSWWANLDIPSGKATVGKPITADASVLLHCADSVPFVRVLSERKEVANWIQGLLSIRDLRGEGRVKVGVDAVEVDDLSITSGNTEVLMRWHRQGRTNRGSVFARYGKLSVGIGVDGDDQEIHLFNARDWFTNPPTAADAVAADETKAPKRREERASRREKRQLMGTSASRAP